MRRLLIPLVACAFALPLVSAPAAAAPLKGCGTVKMTGYPKALAIKVKVKRLSCADAKTMWISYVGTGEALPSPLEELKTSCTDGPPAARKKASKVGRMAIVCRDGNLVTTAWVLGG